ncbi:hypothetical protein HanOQP8_Chr03g0109251 [Helianthus annuus]|nr:hypothetical protein HanOQP8_Chr03g0109251 [Helianthus annuus]KAJ0944081.1 hypothetical protein HanPSC8_Chr03g0112141 [Helianthus annuus]
MIPMDVVVRILNNQLSSLMWIDEKQGMFITVKKTASPEDSDLMVEKRTLKPQRRGLQHSKGNIRSIPHSWDSLLFPFAI